MRPHQCSCSRCLAGDSAISEEHRLLNLILSRTDERTRRWLAALEAYKLESISLASRITGLNYRTIRRGLDELQGNMQGCPAGRLRLQKNGANRDVLQE